MQGNGLFLASPWVLLLIRNFLGAPRGSKTTSVFWCIRVRPTRNGRNVLFSLESSFLSDAEDAC